MADDQLTSAIANWGPRFSANGIDASDYAEVTAQITSWDSWCSAWSAIGARHAELGRRALEAGHRRSAGEHLCQAATSYHFAKFLFVHDVAQMRAAHLQAVRCLTLALPLLDPPGRRIEIPYGGDRLVGVLRLPPGAGPHPCVICIPGLDSAKEEFRPVERAFLDRGIATFSVDGPGQGECEEKLAIEADWENPGRAILDRLSDEHGVDPERIGVWGVSLGGYYAPRVAAGDRRVRACIALSGPYDFGAAFDGLPALTRAAFTLRSHSLDEPEARAKASALTLAGVAEHISCPLLVIFGERDRLFGVEGATRLAQEASGPSELLLLAQGNHGCANGIYRHRPYSADWMAAALGA
jgi:2,6-dihydroxypseudooxynicotine hydrolase